MAVELPFPGLIDFRQWVAGNAFSWAGIEPTASKKTLVIHHSASPTDQDGIDIASFHVNSNGWGGCGYMLVVTHDEYKGRWVKNHEGQSVQIAPAGAQVQYVGDLGTWRAHVKDGNPGKVGICLVGNFVNGHPGKEQLRVARELIEFLMAPNNILPSIKYWNQVVGHGLIGGQQTACPGYAWSNFSDWFGYLQGSGWPYNLFPETLPTPTPEIVPEPGRGSSSVEEQPVPVTVVPEYESSYQPNQQTLTVQRDGAYAVHFPEGTLIENSRSPLAKGGTLVSAGFFFVDGVKYFRSQYASDKGLYNGVASDYFEAATGQPNGEVTVTVTDTPNVTSNPILVTDQELKDAMVPETPGLLEILKELLARLVTRIISKRGTNP